MGRIQRLGGLTANKPSPLYSREEYIDTQKKTVTIGLPGSTEMTLVNTEPGTAEKPVLVWDESSLSYKASAITDIVGNVKKYVAKITQSGVNAPVATVLLNTTGKTLAFERNAEGAYVVGGGAGTFIIGKTTINIIPDYVTVAANVAIQTKHESVNEIEFLTLDDTGSGADEYLANATIEIEIYP